MTTQHSNRNKNLRAAATTLTLTAVIITIVWAISGAPLWALALAFGAAIIATILDRKVTRGR